jgi:hypothetical protein
MKNKKDIVFLIENGLTVKTVSKLNENQIRVLVEKFKKNKKEETNEVEITIDPKNPNDMKIAQEKGLATPDGKITTTVTEEETDDVTDQNALGEDSEEKYTGQEEPHDANDMASDGMDDDSDNNRKNMGVSETEIKEKFESKAQQGLFWARCEECSNKNCKWCKMAKEFSDSTSKKQYKEMPKKKHPEKKVDNIKENDNKDLTNFLVDVISEMVEFNVRPKMNKKDLVNTIKKNKKSNNSMILSNPKKVTMFSNEAPKKLPIGKMFSIGK